MEERCEIATNGKLVVVEYQSLINTPHDSEDFRGKIESAFGPDGVGIIGIRNVPGFVEAKRDLLSLSYSLANLPAEELKQLEVPEALYNTGWSLGKEKLKNDIPDFNKASFYFNPIVDVPGTKEDRIKFPLSYPYNRWPRFESIPSFETAAKRLGSLMKNVAVHVSKRIDDYAHSVNNSYAPQTLYRALVKTEKVKGRLLYYYPLARVDGKESPIHDESEDSWIGWHNDSGFITALSGGLYLEPNGTILPSSPHKDAGLYVVDRKNQVRQVRLPSDCMGIQIGECTQILTGGAVIATPHCVKGAPTVARTSLACFIDTPPTYLLEGPAVSNDHLDSSSSRVPPLSKRWKDGMSFGEFLEKTFKMYYDFDPTLSKPNEETNHNSFEE
mmetsp:Transcript_20349/g.56610  ORF Transcript_20349/g.56610 Transcript_20349/m.56610 type:complete len:386 (-) Transcript_20349:97-1254(-)